ncbi:MAG: DUF4097 domain-containing protein [Rhodothermales bacterium]
MWMRTSGTVLVATLLLFLLAPNASAFQQDRDTEKMIDRSFSVEEGGRLDIEVGDADVEILPGTSDEVHVQVFLEARNMDRARDYFERQHFSVTQHGNTVRVETDAERRFRFSINDWRDHPRILVQVNAPSRFNADVRTSDGDIMVEHLDGDIRLKTSDGDVTAGTLTGSHLSLGTSDGDISIDAIEGDDVTFYTSDGDVILGEIVASGISVRTSDGDIRAQRLDGEAEVKTSDGDLRIEAFHGSSLQARTSDGDITIDELISETSTVRTSDGSITIRHAEGDLNVSGSDADIRLNLVNPGEVTATTSSGDITITLPSAHAADVYLRGDDVRVSSRLDFTGRIDDEKADGELNGGGSRIEARTSDGDVTLRSN